MILDGIIPQVGVQASPGIKIKIEVDCEPPLGFETEEKLLLKPFSFYVKCFTLPNLFAGKMHALLFRKWGTRVKGRDWFDLEWYVRNGVALDLHHFFLRAKDTSDWTENTITQDQLIQLLKDKIHMVSFERIREDIVRFIPDASVLDIWSSQYFIDLADKIKITQKSTSHHNYP